MSIGKMRHRIEIIKEGKEFHKCYCAISEMYGKEKEIAMANKTESFIKFKIRYSIKLKELKKTKLFKVKFEDEIYDLRDLDFNNFQKDWIYLYVVQKR